MYNIRESLKRSVNREADNNVGGKWLTLQSIEACIISHSRVWKGNCALSKGKTSGSPSSVGLPSASPPRCVHRRTRGTISCTTPWKSRNTREQTTAATTVVYVRACVQNYLCTCDGEFHGAMSARQMREHVRSYFARGEERARFEFSRKLAKTVNTLRWRTSCCKLLRIYITHSYILKKSLGFCGDRAFKVLWSNPG